jgi:hypothetical protein
MNYKNAVLNGLESGKNLPHNDRLTKVFNNLLSIEDGYCIEIGAGYGETTVKLLNSVKKFKVIVVDPFEDGWDKMPESYGKPYPFFLFQNATKQFSDKVILIKKSSDDVTVINDLEQYNPIVFSFVDGLQFVENVLHDLNMIYNKNYEVIYQNNNKEVYLVRNEKD